MHQTCIESRVASWSASERAKNTKQTAKRADDFGGKVLHKSLQLNRIAGMGPPCFALRFDITFDVPGLRCAVSSFCTRTHHKTGPRSLDRETRSHDERLVIKARRSPFGRGFEFLFPFLEPFCERNIHDRDQQQQQHVTLSVFGVFGQPIRAAGSHFDDKKGKLNVGLCSRAPRVQHKHALLHCCAGAHGAVIVVLSIARTTRRAPRLTS